MIKNPELFAKELEKLNEWWLTDRLELPNLLRREALNKIIEALEGKRIVQIIGARRVGKTTLLKQSMGYLLTKKSVEARNILYCPLDDPALLVLSDSLLKDVLDFFLENVSKEGRKYVFLDEVHSFNGWYEWLKSFFDRYAEKGVKFIISGSSTLTLQKESSMYLRGRILDIPVYPFSFSEFLSFSGVAVEEINFKDVENMEAVEAAKIGKLVRQLFSQYLLVGGFPEWFEVQDVKKWFEALINDVPKKAVYEDVANLFNIKSPRTLEKMFAFIVENQSKILSYEKINEVAGLHRSVLVNYIEYLKNSYLIIEIPKFAKTVKEQLKSMKKYLCIDQGLRNSLLKDYELKIDNVGFVVENVVGVHLALQGKTFYFRRNGDGEVDFVFSGKLPVEVKYSENPEVTKELVSFMRKNGLGKGVLVTKDIFRTVKLDNLKLYFIPAWLFLLLKL